jgi:hypothetical protein
LSTELLEYVLEKRRRELSTARQILPDLSHRTLASVVWRIEQVLGERRFSQESCPAQPSIALRPDQHATVAFANVVPQAAPSTYDIRTKVGRAAMLKTYKAECKAAGLKVNYKEIGYEVEPESIDPESIVNKWRDCKHPRYERYTRRFLKVFAEKPHLQKQYPSRTAG